MLCSPLPRRSFVLDSGSAEPAAIDRYAAGVREGMALRRGDLIGYVGTSGNARADAPHLHFAVFRLGPERQWWKGEAIDPFDALRWAAEGGFSSAAAPHHSEGIIMGILDILNQYADPSRAPTDRVNDHFDQVARQTNPQDLGSGVAEAFRSDATPPFGQMIGDLFGRSDPQQRAGILNQIIQSVGAGGLGSVAGGILGRVLGGAGGNAPTTLTPEQASQISPADAGAIAENAGKKDPSIMDRAGEFYARHPDLVKGLGAAALAIALGKLHSSRR